MSISHLKTESQEYIEMNKRLMEEIKILKVRHDTLMRIVEYFTCAQFSLLAPYYILTDMLTTGPFRILFCIGTISQNFLPIAYNFNVYDAGIDLDGKYFYEPGAL